MKEKAQFWVALLAVLGVVILGGISLIHDSIVGSTGQVTLILSGGLLAAASAACGWLFRSNGSPPEGPT